MKIALISLYFDPNAMAIRLLSAVLKREFPDDRINIILLSHKAKPPRMDFDLETPEDLMAIQEFFAAEKFDIVGISLMTNYLDRAKQVSLAIRQVSAAKILWGGIHPTLCTEECGQHADIVFVGEAEISLPEVVKRLKNNQSIKDMPGVWSRENGTTGGHGSCPPCMELDSLPSPDYDFRSQFIYSPEERRLIPMRIEYISKSDFAFYGGKPFYRIMTARGCAQACSYCINSRYQKLLGLGKTIRKRSVESVINELEKIREWDVFKSIMFIDDDICLRSEEWLNDFAPLYRKNIGLPFTCNATPIRITANKVRLLKEAGLTGIGMGVQTGSDRLNHEVYNRHINKKHVLRATKIICETSGVGRCYDFLIRSPYENIEDRIETIKLILELPPPYKLVTYALTFFPGLPLTERALRDGLMPSQHADSIYDHEGSSDDRKWKEVLDCSNTITPVERRKLLARLENCTPRNNDELIGLLTNQFTMTPRALLESATRLFPAVQVSDVINALQHMIHLQTTIKGRCCGDVGDRLTQYCAWIQYLRDYPDRAISTGIEIGTLFGGACLLMLNAMQDEKRHGAMICIDPMTGYYDEPEDMSGTPVSAETLLDNLERQGFNKTCVDLRCHLSQSPEARAGLNTKSAAVILIDGDHSADGVLRDWTMYQEHVAEGGFVLFDDYSDPCWPEVTQTVDAILAKLPSGWIALGKLETTFVLRRLTTPPAIKKSTGQPESMEAVKSLLETFSGVERVCALTITRDRELHQLRDQVANRDRSIVQLREQIAQCRSQCREQIAQCREQIAQFRSQCREQIAQFRDLVGNRNRTVAESKALVNQLHKDISGVISSYLRIRWAQLADIEGRKRIYLFGAGKHTDWLLSVVQGHPGPLILGILDDKATPGETKGALPVLRPVEVASKTCDAIVLSTDTFQEVLRQRCRNIFPSNVTIVDLYQDLPPNRLPFSKITNSQHTGDSLS